MQHTQPVSPNENGDVEQQHRRLRQRMEQALLLRGNREFISRKEYGQFLREQFERANKGRSKRLKEEQKLLRALPARRLDAYQKLEVRVGPSSTIRAKSNTYSVHSRLISEKVEVRVYAEWVEVWYAQEKVEAIPRLKGSGGHHINYRHIIGGLLRKPGAFQDYRYQNELFPTSRFRIAYDLLCTGQNGGSQNGGSQNGSGQPLGSERKAAKEYLKILEMAATTGEQEVDEALRYLLDAEEAISAERVKETILFKVELPAPTEVRVAQLDLTAYDTLYDTLLNAPNGQGSVGFQAATQMARQEVCCG